MAFVIVHTSTMPSSRILSKCLSFETRTARSWRHVAAWRTSAGSGVVTNLRQIARKFSSTRTKRVLSISAARTWEAVSEPNSSAYRIISSSHRSFPTSSSAPASKVVSLPSGHRPGSKGAMSREAIRPPRHDPPHPGDHERGREPPLQTREDDEQRGDDAAGAVHSPLRPGILPPVDRRRALHFPPRGPPHRPGVQRGRLRVPLRPLPGRGTREVRGGGPPGDRVPRHLEAAGPRPPLQRLVPLQAAGGGGEEGDRPRHHPR